MENRLSDLPPVNRLLESNAINQYPHSIAVESARLALEEARESIKKGHEISEEKIIERAKEIAGQMFTPVFRTVVNCTGTILNTGLGRARLAKQAVESIQNAAANHVALETDLQAGTRGDRQKPLRKLLTKLTGAESAYVVNNNAAAVFLVVNTFAQNKKVLLSRGQSVEIGGSFRMPDVIKSAGGVLVDVGCTNKTRSSDYEKACDSETTMLLRCHPSNFVISGFVEEPPLRELVEVASKYGLVLMDDVGSGCIIDTAKYGLQHEPTIQESLKAGSHLVTASGDKLLGGPQAGIILGKLEFVERISRNPLARALRIDKFTASALEATLRLYIEGKEDEIPTIRALSKTIEEIRLTANEVKAVITNHKIACEITEGTCEPGGGSLPGVKLPSFRISFPYEKPEEIAQKLRLATPAIVGYIQDGVFHLDMRTVESEDIPFIAQAFEHTVS